MPCGFSTFGPSYRNVIQDYILSQESGGGGEVEKTEKCFQIPDVRDLTCPYSVMRACMEQAPVTSTCYVGLGFVIVSFLLLLRYKVNCKY